MLSPGPFLASGLLGDRRAWHGHLEAWQHPGEEDTHTEHMAHSLRQERRMHPCHRPGSSTSPQPREGSYPPAPSPHPPPTPPLHAGSLFSRSPGTHSLTLFTLRWEGAPRKGNYSTAVGTPTKERTPQEGNQLFLPLCEAEGTPSSPLPALPAARRLKTSPRPPRHQASQNHESMVGAGTGHPQTQQFPGTCGAQAHVPNTEDYK